MQPTITDRELDQLLKQTVQIEFKALKPINIENAVMQAIQKEKISTGYPVPKEVLVISGAIVGVSVLLILVALGMNFGASAWFSNISFAELPEFSINTVNFSNWLLLPRTLSISIVSSLLVLLVGVLFEYRLTGKQRLFFSL